MKSFAKFVVMALLCFTPWMAMAATQKRVQIGTMTVSITNSFGTLFDFTLDSSISAEPVCFAADTWIVDGVSHTFTVGDGSNFCTLPLVNPPFGNTWEVIGCDQNTVDCWALNATEGWVLPSCFNGCTNLTLQLISTTGKAFSFTLASGKKFKTFGVNSSSMSPQPGQLFITSGQVAPLYLASDPSGK